MTRPAERHDTAALTLREARSHAGRDDQLAMLLYEQAATIARNERNHSVLADALNGIAQIEHAHGDSHAALFHFHEALVLRRETRDANGEAGILTNLGVLYTDLGNYNTALEHLLQAQETLTDPDDPKRASVLTANLARVYDALNQPDMAEEHYRRALHSAQSHGQRIGEIILSSNYGDFQRRHGHFREAEGLLRHAVDIARTEGVLEAVALHALALLLRDRGDTDAALEAFAQAMRYARDANDTDAVLEIITGEAETHQQRGAAQEAQRVLEDGVRLAEESGRNRALGRILHLLTDALQRQGNLQAALDTARRANQVDSDVLTAEAERRTKQLATQHELERAKRELEGQRQKYEAQRLAKEQLERDSALQLQELERKALYDALTGLPNRLLLADRYRGAVDHASRHGTRLALGVIDLNKFKSINDTLGHHVGDLLLVEVARRLEPVLSAQDTVARTGGDEFVLLVRDVASDAAVLQVAHRVMKAFEPAFRLGEHELNVRPSLGIAVYPDDALTYEALFDLADRAMYDAKAGGSGFEIHGRQRSDRLVPATLEGALHQALATEQFRLAYQPQTLANGRVRGAEALLRWQHPHFGNVPPADFLPLADATGLSVPILALVLTRACQEATAWGDRVVSVNLTPKQFTHVNLGGLVHAALEQSGLTPQRLEIEVTEEMLASHPERARGILRNLKALGVRVVIDDFGTGFTNFTALKDDPVDGVKIDQALVKDVQPERHGGRDEALVRAVVRMAQALDLDVIAEGVETEYQRGFLAALGVTAVQGFLFAHPQGPEDFRAWLGAH